MRPAHPYRWFLPVLRMDTVPKFVPLIKLVQQETSVMGRPADSRNCRAARSSRHCFRNSIGPTFTKLSPNANDQMSPCKIQ